MSSSPNGEQVKLKGSVIRDYLAQPNFCPSCRSQGFTHQDTGADDNLYWIYLRCDNCEAQWTEEYVLRDVWLTEPGNATGEK